MAHISLCGFSSVATLGRHCAPCGGRQRNCASVERTLVCIEIPRSDTNWGGENEVTVTSEPHNHTRRKDTETDEATSTEGEDKDPERCVNPWGRERRLCGADPFSTHQICRSDTAKLETFHPRNDEMLVPQRTVNDIILVDVLLLKVTCDERIASQATSQVVSSDTGRLTHKLHSIHFKRSAQDRLRDLETFSRDPWRTHKTKILFLFSLTLTDTFPTGSCP